MLDTSIAQPIWPTIGLFVTLALLGGAMIGRGLGQWRAFVLASTAIWAALNSFNRVAFWIDCAVLASGMTFYATAWFRERNRPSRGLAK